MSVTLLVKIKNLFFFFPFKVFLHIQFFFSMLFWQGNKNLKHVVGA